MSIRSAPNTDEYRAGHERVFGKRVVMETTGETAERGEPEWAAHPDVVAKILQTEICQPCNEERPRGEPCLRCGRKLLLG